MKARKPPQAYVVIDTETTGLSVTEDHILEIAALRFEGKRCVDRFVALIQTDRPCSEEAFSCHGITPQEIQEHGLPPIEAFKQFLDFTGNLPLVAHNGLAFDYPLILNHLQRLGLDSASAPLVDTLYLVQEHLGGVWGSISLEALADRYGIEVERAHRAESDCETTAEIFQRILKKESDLSAHWKSCGSLSFESFSTLPAPFTALSRAMKDGRKIQIRYQSKDKPPSDRWIQPIRILVQRDLKLSIEALCLQDHVPKHFRLDRIEKIFE